MKRYTPILLLLLIISFVACNNRQQKKVVKDTSINKLTSYNNLFLDSVRLDSFVNHHPEYKNFKQQFSDFYRERNFEYAWFDSSGLGEQANSFINLLNNTIGNLHDSSLYNHRLYTLYQDFLNKKINDHSKDEIFNIEMYLTGQFFEYADKVYKGTDSSITDLGWFIPRKKIDVTAILDSVIQTRRNADEFGQLNRQYHELSKYLPTYYKLRNIHWDSIAVPAQLLHVNDHSEEIISIKDRLQLLGDLSENDSTALFDSSLLAAIKQFQKRMGLGTDGTIGPQVIAQLNVSPADRIKQLFINLERMRWIPTDKDEKRIFVNIPAYRLYIFDSGKTVMKMNVIVGTAANSTVIFSGNLKYIVFSPYWNVPSSIVKREILPGISRNPNYLANHNMEKTGMAGGLPVIRQKPGGSNSLGRVKFLFPNNYDIYLHDTPNRNLFSASSRNFSHGCIRVGEPVQLANYLLEGDTYWTKQRIDSAMNLEKETWVSLKKTVPVMIGYFTAFVDEDGLLNFRKDIYGHDKKMADKLFLK